MWVSLGRQRSIILPNTAARNFDFSSLNLKGRGDLIKKYIYIYFLSWNVIIGGSTFKFEAFFMLLFIVYLARQYLNDVAGHTVK